MFPNPRSSHNPQSKTPNQKSRGAQPGNTNALAHGAYAARPLTPLSTLTLTLASLRRQMPLVRSASLLQPPSILAGQLIDKTRQVAWQSIDCLKFPESSATASLQASSLCKRTLAFSTKLHDLECNLNRPRHDLDLVARSAIGLIRLDLDRRFPGLLDSFRASSRQEHRDSMDHSSPGNNQPGNTQTCQTANGSLPLFFLTNEQWAIIEPLLPSPNAFFHSRRGPGRGRGRPPADPRRLLDAIFYKLAFGLRWADLPVYFPPMLTCRRYYSRLSRSGYLKDIYTALYQHLFSQGVHLPRLVGRGCFTFLPHHKLALRQGLKSNWELRTSLLFLQVGSQILRHHYYEADLVRRMRNLFNCPSQSSFQKSPPQNQHSFRDSSGQSDFNSLSTLLDSLSKPSSPPKTKTARSQSGSLGEEREDVTHQLLSNDMIAPTYEHLMNISIKSH